MVETVSTDEQDAAAKGQPVPDAMAEDLFNNEYSYQQPVMPDPVTSGGGHSQPPTPTPAPAPVVPPYVETAYSVPNTPAYHPPSVQMPPTSQQSVERPQAVTANHPRQISSGFNPDFLMGGSAESLPESHNIISPAARSVSNSSDYGYDDEDTFDDVQRMKKTAQEANTMASEAQAAYRELASQADELRGDADRQDATARSLKAQANEKKKGAFGKGGGKKKKLLREAETAAQTAEDLRKRFLTVQSQANDAQLTARDARQKAEKLREEAERAELDMAAAASMKDQKPEATAAAPPATNGYQTAPTNYGYGAPAGYGQAPPTPGYGQAPPAPTPGYGQAPPPGGGFGGYGMGPPPANTGYAAGVMGQPPSGGGGGFDLPSPAQMGTPATADNPTNPF